VVRIDDIADTESLPDETVDKFRFRDGNEKTREAGGRISQGSPVLLGITKASLSTDRFNVYDEETKGSYLGGEALDMNIDEPIGEAE